MVKVGKLRLKVHLTCLGSCEPGILSQAHLTPSDLTSEISSLQSTEHRAWHPADAGSASVYCPCDSYHQMGPGVGPGAVRVAQRSREMYSRI